MRLCTSLPGSCVLSNSVKLSTQTIASRRPHERKSAKPGRRSLADKRSLSQTAALLAVASQSEVRGQGIKLGRISLPLPRRRQPEVATRPYSLNELVCMYIYIFIYMYIYICIYMYIYMCTWYTRTERKIFAHTNTYIHTYVRR